MREKHIVAIFLLMAGTALFFLPDHIKLMNCVILTLYLVCAAWWLYNNKPWDAAYWMSAACITFVVTFGYQR